MPTAVLDSTERRCIGENMKASNQVSVMTENGCLFINAPDRVKTSCLNLLLKPYEETLSVLLNDLNKDVVPITEKNVYTTAIDTVLDQITLNFNDNVNTTYKIRYDENNTVHQIILERETNDEETMLALIHDFTELQKSRTTVAVYNKIRQAIKKERVDNIEITLYSDYQNTRLICVENKVIIDWSLLVV